MPRKLKTYQTSLGFYDLAVSAPSMKAALDAWGAGSNLFHQGAAKETDDPDVVAVTMAKPGVVLRRPAGSSGGFAEHSDLPTSEDIEHPRASRSKAKKSTAPKVSEKAASKAAIDFELRRKQREAERRRELAEEAKKRERRDRTTAKAQAAFDEAQRSHDLRAADIEAERAAVEKRRQDEEARWQKEKAKLTDALRRARNE
ncbi:TolA protein [Bradyrhizobium sp. CCBAU 11434]|uniref:cell envelope biogenesis protein TolA n=1 Tax=Bradyrhizobium sp. CCBAU 11434 TaxID=1630885 RepID=UPI0023068D08|nr:cell envelope biogenesis protein TolA [Bradyrhizobium sp. CCBAU 11434]MDA9519769.1 TolA protein [Bradyrhizobium sp. CCBAU 11434]